MRGTGTMKFQKSLHDRKPRQEQEQLFFNSLKGQFKSKEAFLRFNQIKKHKTVKITKAELRTVQAEQDMECRISQRNIFESRKGNAAVYHPLYGMVFLYGGVGLKSYQRLERFDEDTSEFLQLGDADRAGADEFGMPLNTQFKIK